jgi:hypothetical protein
VDRRAHDDGVIPFESGRFRSVRHIDLRHVTALAGSGRDLRRLAFARPVEYQNGTHVFSHLDVVFAAPADIFRSNW